MRCAGQCSFPFCFRDDSVSNPCQSSLNARILHWNCLSLEILFWGFSIKISSLNGYSAMFLCMVMGWNPELCPWQESTPPTTELVPSSVVIFRLSTLRWVSVLYSSKGLVFWVVEWMRVKLFMVSCRICSDNPRYPHGTGNCCSLLLFSIRQRFTDFIEFLKELAFWIFFSISISLSPALTSAVSLSVFILLFF
jgi:hypothetical protein